MSATAALVRPPVDVLHKFSKPVECLALGYLGAALRRADHEAVLLDGMLYDWTVQETADRILATTPDLVGFTVVLNHLPVQVIEISRILRAAGFGGPIIVGGHAVSFFPERILAAAPEIDAVVRGEGEIAIQQIATAVAKGTPWQEAAGVSYRADDGIRSNGVRRLCDLDLLGDPARDLTREIVDNDGLAAVSTSRGCYARCGFCSVPRFYGLERPGPGLPSGDWLGRHPGDMADEVLSLHERFGLLELLIVDDEFFGGSGAGRGRAIEFGDRLAASGAKVGLALSFRAENADPETLLRLRAGGLRHCFIGLESGVDSDLKLYGKGSSADQNKRAVMVVKELGLSFQPGFMMFHYDSSLTNLRRNIEFLREIGELKPTTLNSSVDPHFGTPLVRVMRKEGVLDDQGTRMSMRYKDPRVHTAKLIVEEVAVEFQPFMSTIAALQSAVTYEWRRSVPGRSPGARSAIDDFERRANDGFVGVVEESLEELMRAPSLTRQEALEAARDRLLQARRDLTLARSVLLLYLQREGDVRYVTQRDLMDARRPAGGVGADR